jgi:uncharacterized protein (UPF0548 family)
MFRVTKPQRPAIDTFLTAQSQRTFSYLEVGQSRGGAAAVAGYNVDHNRVQVGVGRGAFELAKQAVRDWKMFEMPWVKLCWPEAPIAVGTNVVVLASHLGFWSLNPCRIVYTIEAVEGAIERYGFAYGTLQGHGAIGEERFSVELRADGEVWYDLYAFSRPGMMAQLCAPLARSLQRRFARDSKAAMVRAVNANTRSAIRKHAR